MKDTRRTAGWLGLIVAILIVGIPLTMVITSALGLGSPAGRPSTLADNVDAVFGSRRFAPAVINTAVLVVVSATLAVIIGTAFAFLVSRTNMLGSRNAVVRLVPVMPFVIPGIVLFFAWIAIYSPRAGFANVALRGLFDVEARSGPIELQTFFGLVAAFTVFLVPLVYLTVRGSLEAASPELESAARVAGASSWRVFRTVTLPLATPAIASATLLALVFGIGLVLIPTLIKVRGWSATVSVSIRRATGATPPDYGEAAMWALLMLAVSLTLILLRRRIVGEREFSTTRLQAVRGGRPDQLDLGWGRWLATLGFGLYALMFVVLPLLGIVVLSLVAFWTPNLEWSSFTFNNFANITELAPFVVPALRNSMLLAILGATVGTALALWLGLAARRSGRRRARWIELLTFMPAAIPPIIVGVGILILVLRGVPVAYGTWFPLLVAYVIITMPFATQIVGAGLARISPDLEMASAVSGARSWTTARRIVVPLMATDLVSAWVFLAVFIIREFDASVILSRAQSGRNPIASTELLGVWENGLGPPAAAFGMLILLSTLLVIGVGGLLGFGLRRAGGR